MHAFDLAAEAAWNPARHVEKILGREGDGDFSLACWEPGQISPNHCHPWATEIYFCYQGGGEMWTEDRTVPIEPGGFVVHPAGELHEYRNGPRRTLLFRVRHGGDPAPRIKEWPSNPDWTPTPEDLAYYPPP